MFLTVTSTQLDHVKLITLHFERYYSDLSDLSNYFGGKALKVTLVNKSLEV